MKFICSRTNLIKSINIAQRAVPVRSSMPILSCILVQAFDNGIFFQSNDMELCIETRLIGTVLETGILAIEAKMFSEIARKLPEEEVVITTNERDQVLIVSGSARFHLMGQNGDEFPGLPEITREEGISISQYSLKNIISQTIFRTLPQDQNLMLTGEYFEIDGSELRVTALDGHRIAIRRSLLNQDCGKKSVIIPGKALSEISKILTGEIDDRVTFYFNGNHVVFLWEGTTLVSNLIDGNYFNTSRMISSEYQTQMVVNRQRLISCIDRAALFVRENDKKPIIFDITDRNLNLSIETPLGAMSEDVSIAKEGRDLMIGFNPKFLMDALRAIEDEEVTMYFINAKSPCTIKDLQNSYTYLVLPVNFLR